MNLIYLCSAGKGRSPLLRAFTKYHAPQDMDLEVDSAGTLEDAIRYLKGFGMGGPSETIMGILCEDGRGDIANIMGEQGIKLFTPELGDWSDYILTADTNNKRDARRIYPVEGKIFTAREFADMEGPDIEDAHWHGQTGLYKGRFRMDSPEAYRMMISECEEVAKAVLEKLKSRL